MLYTLKDVQLRDRIQWPDKEGPGEAFSGYLTGHFEVVGNKITDWHVEFGGNIEHRGSGPLAIFDAHNPCTADPPNICDDAQFNSPSQVGFVKGWTPSSSYYVQLQ